MAATPSAPGGPQSPVITQAKSLVAANPITSAAIAILVAANIFFILYTPIYSSLTPKIGPWPFFYFYMLIYMPVTSLVLWVVTVLQKRLGPARQDQATEAEVRS